MTDASSADQARHSLRIAIDLSIIAEIPLFVKAKPQKSSYFPRSFRNAMRVYRNRRKKISVCSLLREYTLIFRLLIQQKELQR